MITCGHGKILNVPKGTDVFYEINALIKHCVIGNAICKEFDFESEEEQERFEDWIEEETDYIAKELTEYLKNKYDIKEKSGN